MAIQARLSTGRTGYPKNRHGDMWDDGSILPSDGTVPPIPQFGKTEGWCWKVPQPVDSFVAYNTGPPPIRFAELFQTADDASREPS